MLCINCKTAGIHPECLFPARVPSPLPNCGHIELLWSFMHEVHWVHKVHWVRKVLNSPKRLTLQHVILAEWTLVKFTSKCNRNNILQKALIQMQTYANIICLSQASAQAESRYTSNSINIWSSQFPTSVTRIRIKNLTTRLVMRWWEHDMRKNTLGLSLTIAEEDMTSFDPKLLSGQRGRAGILSHDTDWWTQYCS